MKLMKKMSALLLAGALVVASVVPAMAENHTISTDSEKHTYEVYQIFTGTYKDGSLVDLLYGVNSPKYDSTKATAVSQADVEALTTIAGKTYSNDQEKIDDLIPFVNMTNPLATLTASGAEGTVASASLPEGYYVIKDMDNSLEDPETYTLYLFNVLNEDTTIAPKSGTTEHEKHVDDQNDSNATDHTELKDSADYDIGDSIPYTLTATLPENYHDFETYYLQFVDDMSAGLTYNGDAKIYFGADDETGTDITFVADATATSGYTGGTVYKYAIADLKTTASGLTDNAVITIKYTATLNEKAVIGSAGNPNKYKIVYNNNPNNSGEGKPTNETPWDVNIVFTYKAVFNKIDGEKNPLTGADFTLFKKVVDDSEAGFSWVDVTELNKGDAAKNPAKEVSDAGTVKDAVFSFSGLDAGDYKLEETTVPKGYNGIEPILFTINAEHELVAANPALKSLTTTGGLTLTGELATGTFETDIQNNSGAQLPSTGGIGTTIFYVIGGILVVLAAVVLVTRRKAAK